MRRPKLEPWQCPLCERSVTAVHMWFECADDVLPNAIYFHGDGERCFVANHALVGIVSRIREIVDHRENTVAETPQ